ncbi:S-adenosyl-L-methionine-dependent methyltransferase [Elsinoe ampelina]|uniref:S-adenosyl-L-methionine-dependent methyltransferase n=1 Tax=Elsinoe ampelina TaxID=302913 RepID=A0A6A6GHS8_9PEZI|nr:S-adenosyl-L-methionine-dependent methyltransferase [Elsinoe ampelina]
MADDKTHLIEKPTPLIRLYNSYESRIGYKLVLGETRHFGYYEEDTYWPFPFNGPLRAMEDRLAAILNLKKDDHVLDAGSGAAKVAIHLARKGLQVHGVDLVDHHLEKARLNIAAAGLEDRIHVQSGNYQQLEGIINTASMDGVYSMETVVHATDPRKAFREFYRVLKPGGRLAMFEYDHVGKLGQSSQIVAPLEEFNKYASMPGCEMFAPGVIEDMLAEAGFVDIEVRDWSDNIRPMLRFFYVLAFFPYLVISALGLKHHFSNAVGAVLGWRAFKKRLWRFVVVSARKPDVEERSSLGTLQRYAAHC